MGEDDETSFVRGLVEGMRCAINVQCGAELERHKLWLWQRRRPEDVARDIATMIRHRIETELQRRADKPR